MRVSAKSTVDVFRELDSPVISVFPVASAARLTIGFGLFVGRLLSKDVLSVKVSLLSKSSSLTVASPAVVDVPGTSVFKTVSIADANEKTRVTSLRASSEILTKTFDVTSLVSNDSIRDVLMGLPVKVPIVAIHDEVESIVEAQQFKPICPPSLTDTSSTRESMLTTLQGHVDPLQYREKFPVDLAFRRTSKRLRDEIKRGRSVLFKRTTGSLSSYDRGFIETTLYVAHVDLDIPVFALSIPKLYVRLEALDSNKNSISTTSFEITTADIQADLERFVANTSPPLVGVTRLSRTLGVSPQSTTQYTIKSSSIPDLISSDSNIRINRTVNSLTSGNVAVLSTVRGHLTKRPHKSIDSDAVVIPFSLRKRLDKVEVEVTTLPEHVSVALQRRSTRESKFSYVNDVEGIPKQGLGSTVTLIDRTARHDEKYEYRLAIVDSRSRNFYTSNRFEYHHLVSSIMTPAELILSEPTVSSVTMNDGTVVGPIVSIDIKASVSSSDKALNYVRSLLSSNGVPTDILTNVMGSSTSYEKLLVIDGSRVNLTTGEIESLGQVFSGNFVDDSAMTKRQWKPLNYFERYEYRFVVGVRDPSSLLLGVTSTLTDSRTGRSFSSNIGKFRSSVDNSTIGALAPAGSSGDVLKPGNFERYSLGIEDSKRVKFTSEFPDITSLTVRRTFVKTNLLSWRVTGRPELLDHFQIFATLDGVTAMIGASHAYSKTGEFTYEDSDLFDRVGTVVYSVRPVLLDMSPGKQTATSSTLAPSATVTVPASLDRAVWS